MHGAVWPPLKVRVNEPSVAVVPARSGPLLHFAVTAAPASGVPVAARPVRLTAAGLGAGAGLVGPSPPPPQPASAAMAVAISSACAGRVDDLGIDVRTIAGISVRTVMFFS